jgi:hypothetical protein
MKWNLKRTHEPEYAEFTLTHDKSTIIDHTDPERKYDR